MARPEYSEHKILNLEDVIYIDKRCKRALIYKLPNTNPPFFECQRCGNSEKSGSVFPIGEAYVRVSAVQAMVLSLVDIYPAHARTSDVIDDIITRVQQLVDECGYNRAPERPSV